MQSEQDLLSLKSKRGPNALDNVLTTLERLKDRLPPNAAGKSQRERDVNESPNHYIGNRRK